MNCHYRERRNKNHHIKNIRQPCLSVGEKNELNRDKKKRKLAEVTPINEMSKHKNVAKKVQLHNAIAQYDIIDTIYLLR